MESHIQSSAAEKATQHNSSFNWYIQYETNDDATQTRPFWFNELISTKVTERTKNKILVNKVSLSTGTPTQNLTGKEHT